MQFITKMSKLAAKDRLLAARRTNLMIMHSNETSQSDKIEAVKLDAALTMTLLKLDYEGTVFLRYYATTLCFDNIGKL